MKPWLREIHILHHFEAYPRNTMESTCQITICGLCAGESFQKLMKIHSEKTRHGFQKLFGAKTNLSFINFSIINKLYFLWNFSSFLVCMHTVCLPSSPNEEFFMIFPVTNLRVCLINKDLNIFKTSLFLFQTWCAAVIYCLYHTTDHQHESSSAEAHPGHVTGGLGQGKFWWFRHFWCRKQSVPRIMGVDQRAQEFPWRDSAHLPNSHLSN